MRKNVEGDEDKQQGKSKKETILVIDGRPVRKFYTSVFLQRLNYLVITAQTARDGLTFLNLTVPLAIIVNIDLPDMSGAELLKRVKKNDRTRDVPVVIYTSNKGKDIQKDCEQSGCAAYLRHPASLEELYAAIQAATNKPRRFVRLDTFLDVVVDDIHADREDHIVALSELGMFMTTEGQFSYGGIHHFTFQLPSAPGWPIRTEGQVVYHKQSSQTSAQPGIGVKFLKIGDREREIVKNFIREKLMEGISPL